MVRRMRRTGALHGNRFRIGGKAINLTENMRLKDKITMTRNKSVILRENLNFKDKVRTRKDNFDFTNLRQRLDILLARMRGLENA